MRAHGKRKPRGVAAPFALPPLGERPLPAEQLQQQAEVPAVAAGSSNRDRSAPLPLRAFRAATDAVRRVLPSRRAESIVRLAPLEKPSPRLAKSSSRIAPAEAASPPAAAQELRPACPWSDAKGGAAPLLRGPSLPLLGPPPVAAKWLPPPPEVALRPACPWLLRPAAAPAREAVQEEERPAARRPPRRPAGRGAAAAGGMAEGLDGCEPDGGGAAASAAAAAAASAVTRSRAAASSPRRSRPPPAEGVASVARSLSHYPLSTSSSPRALSASPVVGITMAVASGNGEAASRAASQGSMKRRPSFPDWPAGAACEWPGSDASAELRFSAALAAPHAFLVAAELKTASSTSYPRSRSSSPELEEWMSPGSDSAAESSLASGNKEGPRSTDSGSNPHATPLAGWWSNPSAEPSPEVVAARSVVKRQLHDAFLAERGLGASPTSAAIEALHRCAKLSQRRASGACTGESADTSNYPLARMISPTARVVMSC